MVGDGVGEVVDSEVSITYFTMCNLCMGLVMWLMM